MLDDSRQGEPEDERPEQADQHHDRGEADADQGPTNRAGEPPGDRRDYALAEARKAVDRRWLFTPLDGKVPRLKGWTKAPLPTWEQVERWVEAGNVGVRTGSASGVVVVDDDSQDGSAVEGLELPPTVTAITGSGKRHYYFEAPAQGLKNRAGFIPGVDLRADGGQVVFVGSVHPAAGGVYRWAEGLSPDDVKLAPLPQSVLELVEKKEPKRGQKTRSRRARRSVDLPHSAERALQAAAVEVAGAQQGVRNDTLNAEAFRIARWIAIGSLDRARVEQVLLEGALRCGLSEDAARVTIRSGLDAGERKSGAQVGVGPDATAPLGAPKPSIVLEGGQLPEIVDSAEAALLASGAAVYQRGGQLVRPARGGAVTVRQSFLRDEGRLALRPVEPPYLVERFTTAANWFKVTSDDLVPIDCPDRVARTYLARGGDWRVPHLLDVIETPTLRPDGSILDSPGYDSATRLLYDPGKTAFPGVPDRPSRQDARVALDRLLVVLKDFPWQAKSDQSAALAAILTALVRPSLRSAPMFTFRAPKMASGKSLLADVVAMITTGHVAAVMSQGRDEDEVRKRMLALLLEGVAVACIDNVENEFGGDTICSVLTQEFIRDRVLGKSETATVPTTTTWIVTGNNIRFVGDITTRVVPCDLDPRVERPEEREFDVNLYEYVPEHRADLVCAALTVLRAYHVAGRPGQGLRNFGRFEEWSNWVRSSLVWLGQADPCAGRARLDEYDPVSGQLRLLLLAWWERLGADPYSASEVISFAQADSGSGPGARSSRLYDALQAVCSGPGGTLEPRRLGRYLNKFRQRQEGDLRVERCGERNHMALWRVARVAPAPEASADLAGAGGCRGSRGSVPVDRDDVARTPGGLVGEAQEGEVDPDRGEKIPQIPQSPPAPPSSAPGSRLDGDAPGRCYSCSKSTWWRRRSGGSWSCGCCHPPASGEVSIEWSGEADR